MEELIHVEKIVEPPPVATTPPKPKPKNTLDRWVVKTPKDAESPVVHQPKKIKLDKDLRILISPLKPESLPPTENSNSSDVVEIIYEKPVARPESLGGLNPMEMHKLTTAPVKNDGVCHQSEACHVVKKDVKVVPMDVDTSTPTQIIPNKENGATNDAKGSTPEKNPGLPTESSLGSGSAVNAKSPVSSATKQPRRIQLITLSKAAEGASSSVLNLGKGNLD